MASLAKTQIDVPLPPMQASEALVPLLTEQGFVMEAASLPGSADLVFHAERKPLRNALQGAARISDNGSGSTIEIGIDTAAGEAKALLDGRRNRKTLEELTDQVRARLR